MPIVAADWSVEESNGNIRYIGDDHGGASPSYATVIELRRWLGGLSDDLSFVGDDEYDITKEAAADRSTDNIITLLDYSGSGGVTYNIDDTAAEHLYDGSIIQSGGDTIYDGIVNFGNTPTIQIIQNGAVLSDDWWNENGGLNADSASGISHRFMIKVRDAGADIDGRRLIGTTRNFGKTYGEFSINGTSRGNNVLALSEADDLNNQTAEGTIAGYTDIVNDNEGYVGIDASGDGSDEFYYSNWEFGTRTVNDFYERAKYLTRDGSAETLYGLNGELFRGITHEIDIDNPTGTFTEPEAVSWTGGTGQLLAIDSTTAGTKMWIQLLTGVIPTDGQTITGGTSSATADVNVTVTSRSVSIPFVGASTGSAIIGSYGLGIGADDLTASDTVFDLTNTSVTPPNNVTFTVSGLVSTEDTVLVGPESGGGLNKSQMTIATTALSAANITSVEVNAIPGGTPSSGTIRVVDDAGLERRLIYTSYTGATFTIDPTASEADVPNVADFDTTGAAISNNVYVSYIDEVASSTQASVTLVYPGSDIAVFVRVRDGGVGRGDTPIKPFETPSTIGSSGGGVTAIRTSDL